MLDHIIVGGDHQHRVKHFAMLGMLAHEIAAILRIPEERVRMLIHATDDREQFTTDNC